MPDDSAPAKGALFAVPILPDSLAPTLGELFEHYMQHHGDQCKSARPMRGNFNRYLSGLANRPVDQIKPSDVLQLRDYVATHHGRATANRALELVNVVYNRANDWELIVLRNPAKSVRLFKIPSRDRFFSAEDFDRLMKAMDRRPRSAQFNNYIKICFYTGAREANVRSMQWADIDFTSNTWRIPDTKNGKPHVIPLLPEALEVLKSQAVLKSRPDKRLRKRRRKHIDHSVWVFPGRGAKGYTTHDGNSWLRLLKDAGLSGYHIHDLRRTMGSWQAKTGASMPIIGKTLGHSNPSATAIYARLDDQPVRDAMQKAVNGILGHAKQIEAIAALPLDKVTIEAIAAALATHLQPSETKRR